MANATIKDYTVQVLEATKANVLRHLEQSAGVVKAAAADLCAVKTGEMLKTLTHQIDADQLVAHVGYTAPYAYWVETGTRPHVITVKDKKVMYNREQNKFYGTRVNHPGAAAQPSLVPALMSSIPEIERIFGNAAAK